MERIIEIAKKYTEEPGTIDWGRDTSILTDMELTSLELFSFVAEAEAAFGVRIKARELNRIETLGDLFDTLQAKTG